MQKTFITLAGGLILIAGVVMLVAPGPGLVTIAVGLAVLGREYHWARQLHQRVWAKLGRKPKNGGVAGPAADAKPGGDKH